METFDRILFSVREPQYMRYDTIADWVIDTEDDGTITLGMNIVDLGDPRYNFLLKMHETTEAGLCLLAGITTKMVDNFDDMFEAERDPADFTSEPGDDPRAPYHMAHITAETIERVLAIRLGVVWGCYMDACELAFKRVKAVRKNK